MTAAAEAQYRATDRFRHQAVVYRSLEDLVETLVPFVVEGLAHGEQVMVAMPPDRNRALQGALGADAAKVEFLDMLRVGANPARIIPEWRRFVEQAAGATAVRGVGEPVWAGRRDVEIDECALHESLLNVAFDAGPAWSLLCPYDAERLPARALDQALRTHPVVADLERSVAYEGHQHARAAFTGQLPPAPPDAYRFGFRLEDLAGLRDVLRGLAREVHIDRDVVEDLVLAAHELASNSVHHGGGEGVLRAWQEPGAFVVEVRDSGIILDPLVGRERAMALAENGRGVWMANQLCDLVQVRSTAAGTVVRLYSWLDA